MTAIRGFATYLHSLDPAHETPPRDVFRLRKTRPAPYIYTDEQVRALLDACASMIRYGRRYLYPVLFGLIAATGMRLGEALGLGVDEVDLDNGILTVTRGKSRDPRLVPLHPTTTAVLRDYAEGVAPTRRGRSFRTSGAPGDVAATMPVLPTYLGRGDPLLVRLRRAAASRTRRSQPTGAGDPDGAA